METSSDLHLWQSLDTELTQMFDHFSNLIRAAHVPDDDTEYSGLHKEKRAPGDLLEVWAEKLVYSGNTSLHILSQLKKGSLLGDVKALVDNVRAVKGAFERTEYETNARLGAMKLEVLDLLGKLETSYYSSEHRGRVVSANTSEELRELCQLACEAMGSGSTQLRQQNPR